MALAVDLDYSSYQDIREEAGHQHLSKLEDLTGTVNGSNTVFYVKRTYIVDRNYNDVLDVASVNGDVIIYDDDVAVTVSAVDAVTGAITLAAAPATSSVMLATYAYSVLSDIKVGKYRDEAISFVHRKITGVINFGVWESADVPDIIKTVVRTFAAALILIRDYGLNTDTDNSSKDGYKKLATAKSLLNEYLEDISDAAGSTARVSATALSDGNLFFRDTDLTTSGDIDRTDAFMRNDC